MNPVLLALYRWLVEGAFDARTSPDVLSRVSEALNEAGVPIDRSEAFVRTLHPHIVGRSLVWTKGQPFAIGEQTWSFLHSPAFVDGPIGTVFRTGREERRPNAIPGYADFVAVPFLFRSGEVHAVSFATRRAGGFVESDLDAIRYVLPPLSRIAEILALQRTATNLLSTYVGRNAGARVLAGQVVRGSVEPIEAVLWFSDLRGFTEMASRVTPGELIRALNELFECQVPAIEAEGGEVLKFMGDGLLAIFPIDGRRSVPDLCDAALRAADVAFASLGDLNARRRAAADPVLAFGLGLHIGEVAYGNIGSAGRLDFTCIGPAVNLGSRLEGLTGKLGRSTVMSEAFARRTRRPTTLLGTFELKGIPGATPAYGL